jgi:hypothetical protein
MVYFINRVKQPGEELITKIITEKARPGRIGQDD